MSKRPVEISKLIEWLREPGREVARGVYREKGKFCAIGKLMDICGTNFSWIALERCGVKNVDQTFSAISTRNDRSGPLAVADYLERAFPIDGETP